MGKGRKWSGKGGKIGGKGKIRRKIQWEKGGKLNGKIGEISGKKRAGIPWKRWE